MITLSTHLHVSDILIFTGPGLRKATLAQHQLLFESHYRQAHPSHHPGSVKEQPVDPL